MCWTAGAGSPPDEGDKALEERTAPARGARRRIRQVANAQGRLSLLVWALKVHWHRMPARGHSQDRASFAYPVAVAVREARRVPTCVTEPLTPP
jgi:hypothetical protein